MGRPKKILKSTVQEILHQKGLNPFLEMATLLTETVAPEEYLWKEQPIEELTKEELIQALKFHMREPMLTIDQKIEVLKYLGEFVAPKLRASEIRGSVDHQHKVFIADFQQDTAGKVIEITPQSMRQIENGF